MLRSAIAAFLAAAGLATAEVPRPSGNLTITLTNGQKISVNQYRGKVVVLEFMSTTCPHCQTSAKMLTKIQKEYGAKGVQIVGAALNPNPNIPAFMAEFGVGFPVGSADRNESFAYLQHSIMNPNFSVPVLVFVDRAGMVRGQYMGIDPFFGNPDKNVREMLDKLLVERAGSKRPAAKGAAPASAPARKPAAKKKVS